MSDRTRMLGFAAAIALAIPAAHASAEVLTPTKVRITAKSAKVFITPTPTSDIVDEAPNGTQVDVLLADNGWYWVVLPPDGYGTRRGGWVRIRDVDASDPQASAVIVTKAEKALAKREAREARRQARAEARTAKAAERSATKDHAEASASAQPAISKTDREQDKRLKKAQADLEKARADYAAAVKRRTDSGTTTSQR